MTTAERIARNSRIGAEGTIIRRAIKLRDKIEALQADVAALIDDLRERNTAEPSPAMRVLMFNAEITDRELNAAAKRLDNGIDESLSTRT